jgi:IS30 family transposase
MPARRELTMRQSRQMLRLHHDGVSAREIGRTLGVARSIIQDNLERARKAGIGWPLPIEWSDEVLEQRLFARCQPRFDFALKAMSALQACGYFV